MRHSWIALLLIACGGASPKPAPPTPPVAEGPSCGQVADQLIGLLTAEAKAAPQDAVDQMRIELIKACDDTQWSLAARRCVMDAHAAADTQRCEPLFTDAQRQAWAPAEPPAAPPPPPPAPAAAQPVEEAVGASNADADPPAPPKTKAKKAAKSPPRRAKGGGTGLTSDPCDGGE